MQYEIETEENNMDDKFLKDRIDNDDVEIPESLRPENISGLLDKSMEDMKHKGLYDTDDDNVNVTQGGKEKYDKENGKRKVRNMRKYIKSCALAAAALIVVVTGASIMPTLGNKKTGSSIMDNGMDMEGLETNMQETAVLETTQAAGNADMKRTKYDELYEKLTQVNDIYDGGNYVIEDYVNYFGNVDIQAKGDIRDSAEEAEQDVTTGGYDNGIADGAGKESADETQDTGDEDFSKNNDQEESVSEGNIFLTDGKYLYIMKKSGDVYSGTRSLVIYAAENGVLTKCCEIPLDKTDDSDYISYEAMYVEKDMLVLIGYTNKKCYDDYSEKPVTFGTFYDISDRMAPEKINTVTQSGYYESSRITDGVLYLVSSYTPSSSYRQDEYEKYIPLYNDMLVEEENIYCPEYISGNIYTVVGSVDLAKPMTYKDTEAVVADPDNMYVSQNAIYFLASEPWYLYNTWQLYDMGASTDESGVKYVLDELVGEVVNKLKAGDEKTKSTLMKLTIDKGSIEYAGETKVYGSADSQFSFSEHNGYLRLVTTTMDYESGERSCGLYIFDDDLELVGEIDGLADGESVKSVRFLGDIVYFVTFRNTDPLFAVDISVPDKPVIVDEIKLPGFSEYLHPYGEGLLFGLGYEADESNGSLQNVKMSMFDISNPADIEEVDRMQLDAYYSGAMYEHRAILVNADRNLIGFVTEENVISTDDTGANITGELAQVYRLYSYDAEDGFVLHIECVLDLYSYDYPRANYIGDYLYIFDGAGSIYTYELKDYGFIGKTEF